MKKLLICFGLLAMIFAPPVLAQDDDAGTKGVDSFELMEPFDKSKSEIDTSRGAIGIMQQYIGQIFKFGAALISIFAVIMIMWGGYEYMLAGGESGTVENAKNRIMQALLGLTLLFLSAVLLNFINPNFFKLL